MFSWSCISAKYSCLLRRNASAIVSLCLLYSCVSRFQSLSSSAIFNTAPRFLSSSIVAASLSIGRNNLFSQPVFKVSFIFLFSLSSWSHCKSYLSTPCSISFFLSGENLLTNHSFLLIFSVHFILQIIFLDFLLQETHPITIFSYYYSQKKYFCKFFRRFLVIMLEIQDHYFHLAKKDGYVARSAYKLQEIDEKFKLFWFNSRRESKPIVVIDIGCAPGSWLQYTSRKLQEISRRKTGKKKEENNNETEEKQEAVYNHFTTDLQPVSSPLIIWFDLKKVELNLPFTQTFVQDITEQEKVMEIINEQLAISNNNLTLNTYNSKPIDIIISDMAPDTVGNPGADALRSCSLIMETMRMYETLLKKDGKFAIKVFMWPWFEELVQYCRDRRWAAHIKVFKPKACRKESKETYIVKV